MRKRDIDPKLIDNRDTTSKVFVWLVEPDGSRALFGIKRMCAEVGLSFGTFWYRWRLAGKPDEITRSMLSSPAESYKGKSEGWTVDGVWFPSIQAVAAHCNKAESTISERFQVLGTRSATMDELVVGKPRGCVQQPKSPGLKLLPDGTYHQAFELSKMFNVPLSTIKLRRQKGQLSFTRDELECMARKAEQPVKRIAQKAAPVPRWQDVPSPLEGSLMARALSRF